MDELLSAMIYWFIFFGPLTIFVTPFLIWNAIEDYKNKKKGN